ncbi:MAG TPA: tRNA (adenosine(37)-N6)-threonylcarbamoyltransferase complex ATPase subunit type 1 TsaE, partial [Planctomycetaceae bacterium]|nr:tRNA (adenosine(37)-N6)-threonylcarbamoyltransferase complex ATPase subunit type 1 TsaE [Planctomycetaceae bacterium]
MWEFLAADERDTEALGTALGRALGGGGLVALVGPLGAGKTRLVQAIAVALGAERRLVNSPTFVLIQEYEGSLPLYHCDTYRLKNVDEFLDLGIDEIFQSDGVCLIEWADRV